MTTSPATVIRFCATLFLSISTLRADDAARFVSETIADGTIYLADTPFIKAWTLRNTGDTTWDSTYVLRYASGAALSDHLDIPIEGTVPPNGTYTFSKPMTAPATAAGNTREDWKFVSPAGSTIKVGTANTIWVIVYVAPTLDYASFVSETIPDGTSYLAGTKLTKQWTVKNKGLTTWGPGYSLRFAGGATLSDQISIPVTTTVAPNATYTFAKPMIAPAASGPAREDWEMANAEGAGFKVSNSPTVWALIHVTNNAFTNWLTVLGAPIQSYGCLADPDGDGYNNLFEYSAGTSPVDRAAKPDAALRSVAPGLFGYRFRRHPERVELTYELQASTALADWETIARASAGQPAELLSGVEGTLMETAEENGSVTVDYTPPPGTAHRFYRLAVRTP